MPNRHIWAAEGTGSIPDLLGGLFAGILLGDGGGAPLYLFDPYLSDFMLYDNSFGQFSPLFGSDSLAEKDRIFFSEALAFVSRRAVSPIQVRIVTSRHPYSDAFVAKLLGLGANAGIEVRNEGARFHEKGLLGNDFYVEGSINFTYSGVNLKHEKVVCWVASDADGRQSVDRAHIEFERRWKNLSPATTKAAP